MKKEESIRYLIEKGVIKPKFTSKEEKEIKDVMLKGKIYGDPLIETEW